MESERVADLIAATAAALVGEREVLAREIVERMHRDVAGLPDDADLRAAAVAAATQIIPQLVAHVGGRGSLAEFVPPPAAVAYAEELAHRRIAIEVLLSTTRTGYAVFADRWSAALHAGDAPPAVLAAALSGSLLDIFAYIDAISTALTGAHRDELARWSRSVEAMRSEIVRSILENRVSDAAAIEERLGHRLDGMQRTFMVWSDADPAEDTGALLHRAVRELLDAVGVEHCLVLPLDRQALTGWLVGTPAEHGPALVAGRTLGDAVTGVMGGARPGIAGFVESHREAHLARRVARLRGARPGSITCFDDVELIALASADLDHAAAFVGRELGALAAGDGATRRIAETVLVYLQEGRNRARASRRLGVHTNTIAYRLARAEQLRGQPLDARAAELEVALRLAPLVG